MRRRVGGNGANCSGPCRPRGLWILAQVRWGPQRVLSRGETGPEQTREFSERIDGQTHKGAVIYTHPEAGSLPTMIPTDLPATILSPCFPEVLKQEGGRQVRTLKRMT